MSETKQNNSRYRVLTAALSACALSVTMASAANLSVTEIGPGTMIHNMVGSFTILAVNGAPYTLPAGVVATVTSSSSANIVVLSMIGGGGWTCVPGSCTYAGGRPPNTPFPPIKVLAKAIGHGN